MRFGVEWGELEAHDPFGGDGVAVDFGRGEVPAVCGLQGLVGKIATGARGEKFGAGYVTRSINVNLDGDVNGAANGRAGSRRNFGHDLIENFTLGDGGAC